MMDSQYRRIERKAGGVHATPRQFIRAAHGLLHPTARARSVRTLRHRWLREILSMQRKLRGHG